MKKKLPPIESFTPLWEGAKSVENKYPKIGFKIRMYIVGELTKMRQSNPNIFGQKEIQTITNMVLELKNYKASLPPQDQNCDLESYQHFLSDFFQAVDYEDRHLEVTKKTSAKFRLMAGFIDVLKSFEGGMNEEMVKCQKYCKYKAVDIFKALSRGQIPKRGGPNEQEKDDEIGKEIEEMSQNVVGMEFNQENDRLNSALNNNKGNQYNDPFGQNNNMVNYGQNRGQGFADPFGNQNGLNKNDLDDLNNIYGGSNNNKNNANNSYNNNSDKIYNNSDNYGNNKITPNPNNINYSNNNNNNNKFDNSYSNNYNNSYNDSYNNNYNNISNNNYNNNNYNQQQQNQPLTKPQNYNPVVYNIKKPNVGSPESKVLPSIDKNPNKRLFNGKYALNCNIPVKYQTVDYYMLVENVRINNDLAKRELKRGKVSDVLNIVKDSLEFLSYIHK